MSKYVIPISVLVVTLFGIAETAWADNCGSLSDCYGVVKNAAIAGGLIAVFIGLALDFTPITGNIKGIIEALNGHDAAMGEKAECWQKLLDAIFPKDSVLSDPPGNPANPPPGNPPIFEQDPGVGEPKFPPNLLNGESQHPHPTPENLPPGNTPYPPSTNSDLPAEKPPDSLSKGANDIEDIDGVDKVCPPPNNPSAESPNIIGAIVQKKKKIHIHDIHGTAIGEINDTQGGVNISQTNITSTEQKQDLAEAAAEIQKLLKQLEQNNPTATEAEKEAFVSAAIPITKKERFFNALTAGGKGAIEEFLDNPYVNVAIKIIEGWKNV